MEWNFHGWFLESFFFFVGADSDSVREKSDRIEMRMEAYAKRQLDQ